MIFKKNKKISSFMGYFLLIFIVPVFLFLFLETCLQVSSFIYTNIKKQYNTPRIFHKEKQTRILCLGESTTALGLGDSYPATLQRLLHEKYPTQDIVVINEGVSGTDTQQILTSLPRKLKLYRPQIVITMMGINDSWNLYAHKELNGSILVASLNYILKILPKKSRVYKLFFLTKINFLWKKQVEKLKGKGPNQDENYEKNLVELENKKNQISKQFYFSQKALLLYLTKNFEEAKNTYQQALEFGPKNVDLLKGLGLSYLNLGDKKMAKEKLDLAIKLSGNVDLALEVAFKMYGDNRFINSDIYLHYFLYGLSQKAQDLNVLKNVIPVLIEIYSVIPEQVNFNLAKKYFKKSLVLNVENKNSHCTYIDALIKNEKFDDALSAIDKSLNIPNQQNAMSDICSTPKLWNLKIYTLTFRGDKYLAQSFLDLAKKKFPEFKQFPQSLDHIENLKSFFPKKLTAVQAMENPYEQNITSENYHSIVSLIQNNGSISLAMQYPNRRLEPLKEILKKNQNVIFIDQFDSFKEALKKYQFDELFVDNFAGDTGHYTPLGAKILANQILKTLEAKKVLNFHF